MIHARKIANRIGVSALVLGMIVMFAGQSTHVMAEDKPAAAPAVDPQDVLRPEVSKILIEAQAMIVDKKGTDALAKLKDAEAIANHTAYETYLIYRLKADAGRVNQDWPLALEAIQAAIATNYAKENSKLNNYMLAAEMYDRMKDYKSAAGQINRIIAEGGDTPTNHQLLVRDYFLAADYQSAIKEATALIDSESKAGRVAPENTFGVLVDSYSKLKDAQNTNKALEQLVRYYPNQDRWNLLVRRIPSTPGYQLRMDFEYYVLKIEVGDGDSGDYEGLAMMSLQQGYGSLAKKIMEEGYAAKQLGQDGDAAKHKKLMDSANKAAADEAKTGAQAEATVTKAKDGTGLANLGYGYALTGQAEKGAAMIEQAIAKGGLKRPEEAKLHLGIALAKAGQKEKAIEILKTVQGEDGAATIARYWIMWINKPVTK